MMDQLLNNSAPQVLNYAKQRNQSLPPSTRARTTPKSSRSSSMSQKKCIFCKKTTSKNTHQVSLSSMINKALYSKYSASQNYHYTREINDIISNAKTSKVIKIVDWEHFDEEEEYLKRFYRHAEYNIKLKTLTEYYKFHKDVARIFMRPASDTLNRYHDKKRRIEYIRITKMLQEEEEREQGITSEQKNPEKEENKDILITDRFLDDLDKSNFESRTSNAQLHEKLGKIGIMDRLTKNIEKEAGRSLNTYESVKSDIVNKYLKDHVGSKGIVKSERQPTKKSHEISISNTIHDLNQKLAEIISNSNSQCVHFDVPNFLETCEQKQDDTLPELPDNGQTKQKSRKSINIVNIDLVKPTTHPDAQPTLRTSPVNYRNTEAFGEEDDVAAMFPVNQIKAHLMAQKLKDAGISIPKTTTKLFTKKLSRKPSQQENKMTHEDEGSVIIHNTEREISRKSSLGKEKTRKRTTSITKIKGFEEVLAIQQQGGGQSKVNSQRSLSGEKTSKKSRLNSTTRKNNDEKAKNKEDGHLDFRASLKRRESCTNSKELSKSKEKSITSNKYGSSAKAKQHIEIQEPKTKSVTRAKSHKKIRISIDMNQSGKHPSQQISFHNLTNLTGTVKALNSTGQIKGFPKTQNNFNAKIMSQKALTSRTTVKPGKEIKNLLDQAKKANKPQTRLSSRERSNSHENYQVPEDGITNMKKSAEQFYGKIVNRRKSQNPTQYTKTKSEESLHRHNSMEKTSNLSKTKKTINFQPLKSEEDKYHAHEDDKANKKHVYTYNNSNVVNIFVHPGDNMVIDEQPYVIIAKNGKPKEPTKHDTKIKVKNLGEDPKKQEKAHDLGEDNKHERANKSPMKTLRRSKSRLSKSKSGLLETVGKGTRESQL